MNHLYLMLNEYDQDRWGEGDPIGGGLVDNSISGRPEWLYERGTKTRKRLFTKVRFREGRQIQTVHLLSTTPSLLTFNVYIRL